MKKENKMTIWQDIDVDPADWQEFFDEEYPDATEDERWRLALEMNADYLDDERMNLNRPLSGRVVVLADLGLWNGRRGAYKVLRSGNRPANLNDIFFDDRCDYHEWYVADGEVRCTAIHHDGTNHYIFRELPASCPGDDYMDILNGVADTETVMHCTRSLAPDVAAVYGWNPEDCGIEAETSAAKSAA